MKQQKFKKSTIINPAIAAAKVAKPERYYVDKEKFYQAIVERHKEIQRLEEQGIFEKPKISDYIGECITLICTNLARKYNFTGYHFKDEMVQDAIVHCLKYIDSFDIDKSRNPFSYFTQAAYFQFIGRIMSEKHQLYVQAKAALESAVLDELSDHGDTGNDVHQFNNIEVMALDMNFYDTFVKEYEEALEKKNREKPVKDKSPGKPKRNVEYALDIL